LLFYNTTSAIISQIPIPTMTTMQNMMTESDFRVLKTIIRKTNLQCLLGPHWFKIVEGTDFDSDDASRERHGQFMNDMISKMNSSLKVPEIPDDWETITPEDKPYTESAETYREKLSPEIKIVWEKIVSGEINIDQADWIK